MDNTTNAIDTEAETLRAVREHDGWRVESSHNGIWRPSEEAAAEIEAVGDEDAQMLCVYEILDETPMRGEWSQ